MSTMHTERDDGGAEGPERGTEARSAEVPRGMRSEEGRHSPSPVWGSGGNAVPRKFRNLTVQICLFFPRFQDRDSISVRNLHCILLLHITHSSKVNCTLVKVNCTLCVRKHTILGPHVRTWSSTCEHETPRAHVDTVDVRTWSFTFAREVLVSRSHVEHHVRTRNSVQVCDYLDTHCSPQTGPTCHVYVRTSPAASDCSWILLAN